MCSCVFFSLFNTGHKIRSSCFHHPQYNRRSDRCRNCGDRRRWSKLGLEWCITSTRGLDHRTRNRGLFCSYPLPDHKVFRHETKESCTSCPYQYSILFWTYHGFINHAHRLKGAASASDAVKTWGPGEYVGVIFGIAIGCALLSVIFLIPFLYRKLVLNDWQLHWWHILQGPLLLRRGEVPPNTSGREIIQNYYKRHKTRAELNAEGSDTVKTVPSDDVESKSNEDANEKHGISSISPASSDIDSSTRNEITATPVLKNVEDIPAKPWYDPPTSSPPQNVYFSTASPSTSSPNKRNPPF
ncbi:hypothetical protein EAF04_000258 [Stromatinia cepivora]|nr:hypothetical protein EAF04_000258 [Stromatinia cepivora]